MNTGSRLIIVNASPTVCLPVGNKAQVEEMRHGYRAITNPTLEEFNGFMKHEGGSWKARFVVDKDRGNIHFAHAATSVHPDIIRHFGIGENHDIGFMERGGMDEHYAGMYETDTQPYLQKYIVRSPEPIGNTQGVLDLGISPQQGYEQWRSEVGSGENQYPTNYPTAPSEPQPLDEWEGHLPLPKGTSSRSVRRNRPAGQGKPASRYQQPFGDQNIGQGKGLEDKSPNRGPLEY